MNRFKDLAVQGVNEKKIALLDDTGKVVPGTTMSFTNNTMIGIRNGELYNYTPGLNVNFNSGRINAIAGGSNPYIDVEYLDIERVISTDDNGKLLIPAQTGDREFPLINTELHDVPVGFHFYMLNQVTSTIHCTPQNSDIVYSPNDSFTVNPLSKSHYIYLGDHKWLHEIENNLYNSSGNFYSNISSVPLFARHCGTHHIFNNFSANCQITLPASASVSVGWWVKLILYQASGGFTVNLAAAGSDTIGSLSQGGVFQTNFDLEPPGCSLIISRVAGGTPWWAEGYLQQ